MVVTLPFKNGILDEHAMYGSWTVSKMHTVSLCWLKMHFIFTEDVLKVEILKQYLPQDVLDQKTIITCTESS